MVSPPPALRVSPRLSRARSPPAAGRPAVGDAVRGMEVGRRPPLPQIPLVRAVREEAVAARRCHDSRAAEAAGGRRAPRVGSEEALENRARPARRGH